MKDRKNLPKGKTRNKAAEREADHQRRKALWDRVPSEPGWRIDGMVRPFKQGS